MVEIALKKKKKKVEGKKKKKKGLGLTWKAKSEVSKIRV